MKESGWFDCRQGTDVIGNVKIKSVVTGSFENDVLSTLTKRLKRGRECNRNLGLIGAEKNFDLEGTVLEQANVFRLHIFEINQYVIRACCHKKPFKRNRRSYFD